MSAGMLLLLLLAACGSDATATLLSPTATPVPQINNVTFAAEDYGFTGPASIPAGMTTITMVNEGQELHHQQLIKVPEGMTALDLLAAFEPGVEGPPPPGVAAAGGVAALAPGVTGSVTLNLEAGNYVMSASFPTTTECLTWSWAW